MEELDPAHRHRADRVPVVGVAQADEPGALRRPHVLLVLVGHLHGDLGGRRAVVGEEHPLQAGRCDLHQPARQLSRSGVGEAEHRGVRDPVELGAHRGVDARVTVTVDGAPQR